LILQRRESESLPVMEFVETGGRDPS
jgi:hypothetical protein